MLQRLKFVFLAIAISLPAWAEETMTLNLNNADIRVLINTVSEMTGKNFIVDPRVKGKVTVISASPSDRKHIYEIFLSVLKVHGFAVVPSGDVIKIVPNTVAKQDNIRTITQGRVRNTDETATRVVEVKHVMASQLVPILRPLMPQQAHLGVHADSNSLIVSDSVANMNRIIGIIRRIDRVGDHEIEIIKLEYANATELVQVLSALRGAGAKGKAGPPGQRLTLVADPRTNSILLGGKPDQRLELRALIAYLDTPIQSEGNIEVIYLRYAEAKDLVAVLKGIGDKQVEAEADAKQQKQSKPLFDIQADEATNALVVTAPPAIMKTLKTVINQLDIRRAQVYIEAIIAELSDDKARELGVQWRTSQPGKGIGASFFASRAEPGIAIGTGGFNLGYFSSGSLRVLLNALATDSDTNILSTPSLLTMDNEEASIHVGENVPFVTGSYTSTTDDSTDPFQTVERHDVGIKLNVIPQINEGDTIKLKIEQEVSRVVDNELVDGLTTSKRTIETTILVDDKQTIVLGGLIRDDLTESVSKVPLLGDIPLLGNLFKSTTSTLVKRNLMVFLRPEIIRDQNTSMQLTNSKYRYIRGLQQDVRKGAKKSTFRLMPSDSETPLLPALESQTSPTDKPDAAGADNPPGQAE